jgi:hypothetical protein
LLKEGLARCIDWSMGVVSQGSEKYRLAEKYYYCLSLFVIRLYIFFLDKQNKLNYVYGNLIKQQVQI